MQGGMQFPLTLSTNKLLKKILDCEVGTTVYLGPKLSGAISVDLLADNTYDMFKDSKLSLSYFCADYETKAKMKAFWGSDDEVTLADGSFSLLSDIEVYLFPEFEVETEVEDGGFDYSNYGRDDLLDATSGYLKATIKPSRNILWPLSVGIGVFEGEKMIYSDYAPSKYSQFSKGWKAQDSWTKNNLILKAGPYTVRPLIEIGGHDIKASPAQKIIVPGAYLRATADINYPQATQIIAWYDEAGNPKNTVTIESSCDKVEWLHINAGHPLVEGYTLVPAGDGIWNVKCDLPVNYNLWKTGGLNTLRLYGTYYDKNGKTIYLGRILHVIQDRNRTFAPDKGFEFILRTSWAHHEFNNIQPTVTFGEENLHIQYSGTIPEKYSFVGSDITGKTEFAISFDVSLLEGKINSNNSYFSEFYVDGDGEEHKSTYQLDNLIVSFGKKNGKAVMTISCQYGWFYFFFE